MRVIAGKARSLRLQAPPGMDTRPTTDRIKETLFNMIRDELYDVNFLDLFAGSGGIGIEALSRGARHACFVEQDGRAVEVIRQNLRFTHLEEQAEICQASALSAVRRMAGKERFHVAFMDPPYDRGLEQEILREPAFWRILQENALVIVEASLDTDLQMEGLHGFRLLKEKRYKTNKHIFLERVEHPEQMAGNATQA